jgi:hypothetical protein
MVTTLDQVLGAARQAPPGSMGDVLDAQHELELFPEDSADQAKRARAIRDLAIRSMALAMAVGAMRGRGAEAGSSQQKVKAMRGIYRTPWQLALQIWLEGVAPGERTFTRASRRGNDRSDVVMPGRKRHSWMLNVILDTSASMSDEIPFALGAIADFCDVADVDEVRLVQCDTVVTSDEMLSPSELADYQVSGYGGAISRRPLLALAEDPRVTAAWPSPTVILVTPASLSPALLWALPQQAGLPAALRAGHYDASEDAMKVVRACRDFDRRESCHAAAAQALEQNLAASDAPTNMHGLCETVGATYYFRVTGVTEGSCGAPISTAATRRSALPPYMPAC